MRMTKEANILIVEDQEINIRLLKGMLINEGYTNVLFTSDAREALPLFREFQPDLVLLDLHMPHFDGFEVMDQFSEFTWGDYVPILVLTGDLNSQTRQRALMCGAMDFINKPFKVAEVLLRANNFLQARLLHLQLKSENHLLLEEARANTQKLEAAQVGLLERLAVAAESRADYTGDHTRRVAQLAARLGEQMGMSEKDVALLERAAPLHDIGKITVPDYILLKPAPLTEKEHEMMRAHVKAGAQLLQDGYGEMIKMAEEIALTHHEKWDGSGYPHGLRGEEIPLVGRIVALADVYDALISERPYKIAWSPEKARAEILAQSGLHFDPLVVKAFFDFIESGREAQLEAKRGKAEEKMRRHAWLRIANTEGTGSLLCNGCSM